MAKYVVNAINAGGAYHEELETSDDVFAVLKFAMRLRHPDMINIFEPKDYSRGENWTVEILVKEDEAGNTFEDDARLPVIYSRDIPTVKKRGKR